ncbi:uncharacterized protein SAPINGB_P002552 [Magnusiomyces paraingens]|uniref:UNC-50 family protein n=1 Tax=Magnusiomyces paraingens TaxID=2606893 RepID=A0A5E8BEI1_9ASCO|nr:uncharacterized protein SAPINGB_P002552 [Saprochaete ingens]VVT50003.1 unnamed protein product [Saprochaete ingens]
MPLLPLTNGRAPSGLSGSHGSGLRLPTVIRRVLRPPTLDFETAVWELVYLLIAPTKVYKSLYYHKQTKNRWARDDPSFVLLLSALLAVSALAWGLAYSPGVFAIFRLVGYMVLVDFFAVGVVIATAGYLIAGKLLRKTGHGHSQGRDELEWAYCFDVHCNAFLVIWVYLYVLQFLLLPLLTRSAWFAMFLGNSLYAVALAHYCVIAFYGYNALPFLAHTELLLAPVPVIAVLYILSLFGFNVVKTMGSIYFGK